MSWLDNKGTQLLLEAGFSEADIGLVSGGKIGVSLYESPEDYFAKELIENACEQGLCSLYDDDHLICADITEPYDNDRKGMYEDNEYDGNDDITLDVDINLRPQVDFLKRINIGKLSMWQSRKGNRFYDQVKRVELDIPKKEQYRMYKMSAPERKEAYKSFARAGWSELWKNAVSTLYSVICEFVEIKTQKGQLNLIIINTEDMRNIGHKVPKEANWVTMLYFEKDIKRILMKPRNML